MLNTPKATSFQLVLHWSVDVHFSCYWFFTLTSGAAVGSLTPVRLSMRCRLSGERTGVDPLRRGACLSAPPPSPWLRSWSCCHQQLRVPVVSHLCPLPALASCQSDGGRNGILFWFAFPRLLVKRGVLFVLIWFLQSVGFFCFSTVAFQSLTDSGFCL